MSTDAQAQALLKIAEAIERLADEIHWITQGEDAQTPFLIIAKSIEDAGQSIGEALARRHVGGHCSNCCRGEAYEREFP